MIYNTDKDNMNKTIMTVDQAYNVSMNKYPSLYTSSTIEQSQMKYYDHIFNVIGNGFRDMNEFLREHTINSKNQMYIDNFPDKYITNEPLYYVYKKVNKIGSLIVGDQNSVIKGIFTVEEIANMPEAKHYVQCNDGINKKEKSEFIPYPNFSKEYSLVWDNISKLDPSWLKAAIVFYTKCQDYFNSDQVFTYHHAHPKNNNDKKWDYLISQFQNSFDKYKTEGITDKQYHAIISKEYECPFDGDIKKFIKIRWENELKNINKFIEETLERLNIELKVDKTLKNKM